MKWYEFKPSDTLFFRGDEPMIAGLDYETTLAFPPSTSVLSGAMRTAVLAQNFVSISNYKNGDPISKKIGSYGKEAPFLVIGPLVMYRSDYYVPAPYSWFTDSIRGNRKVNIIKPFQLDSDIKSRLGLKSSSNRIHWVKHDNEVKTKGGNWILLKGLLKRKSRFEKGKSIFTSDNVEASLFSVEERTGISIDRHRKVEESKLYSARHIRLKSGASLVWGINRDCGLEKNGVLVLGGEQRFGKYKELEAGPEFSDTGDDYLALSPVLVSEESQNALIGTGKISYRGGWDLAVQFHKDMKGFYPAGSVFSNNINSCCISF